MKQTEHRDFAEPDEVRPFEKGRAEILNVADGAVGRFVLEPGWRWSEHVKSIAGTEWCEAPHFQYQIAGRIGVRMSDGTEFEVGPGEVTALRAGHDAWVIGDEAAVIVDWMGAVHYAESD